MNKTIIISGGARGIGRALALACGEMGATVAFNYVRNKDAADELVGQINAAGGKALAAQVDIRDYTAVGAWIQNVRAECADIDVLINNAGITRDKALMFMTKEDWHDVIDTNLNGLFNLTRAVVTTFLKKKQGNVINITSISGIIGLPRQVNYSASKAGIIGFTKALAKETAAYGIRVNAVAPGFIETDMVKDLKDAYKEEMIKRIPLASFGTVDDVTGVVKYLMSAQSSYLTGQVLVVDGGMTMVQ